MKRVVLGGEAAILVLVFSMGMLGLSNISTLHQEMEEIVDVHAKKMRLAHTMRDAVRMRMMHLLKISSERDAFERDAELMRFYPVAGVFRAAYLEFVENRLSSEEDRLAQAIGSKARMTQVKARAWVDSMHLGVEQDSELKQLFQEVEQGQAALLSKLNQMVWLQKKMLEKAEEGMDQSHAEIKVVYSAIVLLVIVLIVVISYLMLSFIRRSQYELIEKNHALERATEVKSRFLATMSHEIRTPMNGVLGIASLLGETSLDSQQREYVDLIQSSGDRLLLLINDILDFSKIEAGHMQTTKVSFWFNKLVYECVDMMLPAAQKKHLELVLDLAPEVHRTVQSDPDRLRQVMINLLSNAIKFTRQGTIVVTATCSSEDRLKLSIVDTGSGIPETFKGRIFKPFSQLQDGSNRSHGGTGLGLAISHDLIHVMGGEMGYESTVGVGTCFWFEIPVGPMTESFTQPKTNSKRVLLLDDIDASRQAFKVALEYLGYEVELAMNTNNAMDMLFAAERSKKSYDFLLIDQSIPGIDGQEFARSVSRNDSLGEICTVLLVPMGAAILQANEIIGVDATLVKPFRYETLAGVLEGFAEAVIVEDKSMAEEKVMEPVERQSTAGYMLVAEDNPVNQKVIVGMLQKLGYAVRVTDNGKQALEAAKQEQFDLIFMDCQMPVMDGYEATGELKKMMQQGILSSIPVIAITANALVGDREKCLAAGMDDFMSKPIKLQDLQAMTDSWLNQGKEGAQSTA